MDKVWEIALATVGMTEVVKNFIQKGGKRIWTLVALVIGAGMVCVAEFLPETFLHGIVAVSVAVVFYDAIYKKLKALAEKKE